MRPGDVVECQACGGSATATFSSGRFQDGFPCALRWTHRGTPRTMVTHEKPELCPYCYERVQAIGEPWPRLTPAELAIATSSAVPPGEAFLVGIVTGADGAPRLEAVKVQQLALF